jgi:hypothetical protein
MSDRHPLYGGALQAGLEALNEHERAHQARCQALRAWCEQGFAVVREGYVAGELAAGTYQGSRAVYISQMDDTVDAAETGFRDAWERARQLAREHGATLLHWRTPPRVRTLQDPLRDVTRYWVEARAWFSLPVEGESDE